MNSGKYEFDREGRRLFRPTIPQFPRPEDIVEPLRSATAALAEFDNRLSTLDNPEPLCRLFNRLDAVCSSAAEGSTTSFRTLMEYESDLRIAPDRHDAAGVSAVSNALDTPIPKDDLIAFILSIHHQLFKDAPNVSMAATAWTFKKRPNFVRDTDSPSSLFGYTAPSSVQSALSAWSTFTLARDNEANELVRQILSHWVFEHIHPVSDGNGRIGRLLVPTVMRSKGATQNACTFLGEAIHKDKSLYIEILKDARVSGNPTNYVRQMLRFLQKTAESNIARLDAIEAIKADWSARRAAVNNGVVFQLCRYAIAKPVFNVNEVQRALNVNLTTADMATRMLFDEGVLTSPDDPRRDSLFYADAVIRLFDDPKAGQWHTPCR